MGQILHGCAATTETVRRVIQHSQESLMVLLQWADMESIQRRSQSGANAHM